MPTNAILNDWSSHKTRQISLGLDLGLVLALGLALVLALGLGLVLALGLVTLYFLFNHPINMCTLNLSEDREAGRDYW